MDTPICDFVRSYTEKSPLRLHMPGHKGTPLTGPEALDITEIPGADVLYHAEGIIRRSQENAAALFGSARTLYSTEGSSLCIRAMLYLAMMHARAAGRKPLIAAGRNAHKVFLSAAALLDLDVLWLYAEQAGQSLVSCALSPESLDDALCRAAVKPTAVYITSPDYLGNLADLSGLSAVCRKHGALLLVDNAHGAYLKFLPESCHPMDLGADLCCDSAHKTLGVLTGGAYLHLSHRCPESLLRMAEQAMALFASTSPSYLILQSLDRANRALAEGYRARLARTAQRLDALKGDLARAGWQMAGQEKLKLTLCPKSRGYTGSSLANALEASGIFCEFSDPDNIVFMLTPETADADFARLKQALDTLTPLKAISGGPPPIPQPRRCLSPRQAMLSPFETLPVSDCVGRVLAAPSVSCPPAVPILVCGEQIDENALRLFRYYGVPRCDVVKEAFAYF